MKQVVVILEGAELNATLAGIEYNQWGEKTNQPIIICDSWQHGLEQAYSQGYQQALFVRSGTVFLDWDKWKTLLNNCPHQGLVAHLVWPSDLYPYIDDQCWYVDLTAFDADDLNVKTITSYEPIGSSKNLQHVPLQITSGSSIITQSATHFGQGLIAKQLNNKKIVSDWTDQACDLKFFCYPDTDVRDKVQSLFCEYLKLAENQLWIFNNEQFSISNRIKLVTPGSGLHWIFNIVQPQTTHVHVVDISQTQIAFCNALWKQWDGHDYGFFSWNFIKNNQLNHYEIDQDNLSDLERLMLKTPSRFIKYVNDKFEQMLVKYDIKNFQDKWKFATQQKELTVTNDNLVHWVLAHPWEKSNLWASNILDYKWTKLNTSAADCKKFENLV
jgi:hypothetical protein